MTVVVGHGWLVWPRSTIWPLMMRGGHQSVAFNPLTPEILRCLPDTATLSQSIYSLSIKREIESMLSPSRMSRRGEEWFFRCPEENHARTGSACFGLSRIRQGSKDAERINK